VTHFNEQVFEAMTFSAAVTASTRKSFGFRDDPRADSASSAGGEAGDDHRSCRWRAVYAECRHRWNKSEIELFGSPLLEHAERYEMADEWITLMKAAMDIGRTGRFRRLLLHG